mmetsp:Transcript_20939/g.39289  ORF Transcript_20939/g.39289 Transcript_20939/m.39289 type:complete len:258 (+) Transcript_20939:310-1083(+)
MKASDHLRVAFELGRWPLGANIPADNGVVVASRVEVRVVAIQHRTWVEVLPRLRSVEVPDLFTRIAGEHDDAILICASNQILSIFARMQVERREGHVVIAERVHVVPIGFLHGFGVDAMDVVVLLEAYIEQMGVVFPSPLDTLHAATELKAPLQLAFGLLLRCRDGVNAHLLVIRARGHQRPIAVPPDSVDVLPVLFEIPNDLGLNCAREQLRFVLGLEIYNILSAVHTSNGNKIVSRVEVGCQDRGLEESRFDGGC